MFPSPLAHIPAQLLLWGNTTILVGLCGLTLPSCSRTNLGELVSQSCLHRSLSWGCSDGAAGPSPPSQHCLQLQLSPTALGAHRYFQLLAVCICSGAGFPPRLLPAHPPLVMLEVVGCKSQHSGASPASPSFLPLTRAFPGAAGCR